MPASHVHQSIAIPSGFRDVRQEFASETMRSPRTESALTANGNGSERGPKILVVGGVRPSLSVS